MGERFKKSMQGKMFFLQATFIGLPKSQVGQRKMQFHYTNLIMGTHVFLDNLLSHLLNNSFYPLIYLHLMRSAFSARYIHLFRDVQLEDLKAKEKSLNAINYSMAKMA